MIAYPALVLDGYDGTPVIKTAGKWLIGGMHKRIITHNISAYH